LNEEIKKELAGANVRVFAGHILIKLKKLLQAHCRRASTAKKRKV